MVRKARITSHKKPRGLRGSYKGTDKKALSKVIDVNKNYNFRPYHFVTLFRLEQRSLDCAWGGHSSCSLVSVSHRPFCIAAFKAGQKGECR